MLKNLVAQKRTLIVVGPGGVGKTTTSAAFAVHAARSGLKTLVLTVDPARRLADSLGLEALGNQEVEIDRALFADAGVPLPEGGSLWGMMLDTKRTFDAVIERHAPSAEVRDQIFANPFYEQASSALAGSQEYMAMEKLYEIRTSRDYDLIVLDTPPTANALDFLSAADRLEDFLGSAGTRAIVRGMKAAGRVGLGFLRFNSFVMRGLNKFVGADTFVNLLDFIQSFHEMYAGFKARAANVKRILRSDDVAFVIVSSTNKSAMDESLFFADQLRAEAMPFGAFVVNRVRPSFLPLTEVDQLATHLAAVAAGAPNLADADPTLLASVIDVTSEACLRYETLSQVDADRVDGLRTRLGDQGGLVWPVPLFGTDIHDITGLARFAEHVVAETDQSPDASSVA